MISAEKKMQRTAFFCYSDDKNAARCIFITLTGGGEMAVKGDLAVGGNANRNAGQRCLLCYLFTFSLFNSHDNSGKQKGCRAYAQHPN